MPNDAMEILRNNYDPKPAPTLDVQVGDWVRIGELYEVQAVGPHTVTTTDGYIQMKAWITEVRRG